MKERVLAIERGIRAHTQRLCGSSGDLSVDPVSIEILGFSENPGWTATEVFTPVSDSGFSLYIGGVLDAQNEAELSLRGITAVLNCAALQTPYARHRLALTKPDRKYLALPLEDRPAFSLAPFLPEAEQFLEICREERRKVLVHCMQGLNRSVAVVAVFLAKHFFANDAEAAIDHLASRRPHVLSNRGFIAQTLRYLQPLPVSVPQPGPASPASVAQRETRQARVFAVKDVVLREEP